MRQWLWLGLTVLFLLLVGGSVIGYVAVRKYLHSDDFRHLVEGQLATVLKAESVEMDAFAWSGLSMTSDGMLADGGSAGKFDGIELKTLETEVTLDGLDRGVWEIPQVTVAYAKLDLMPPTASSPSDVVAAGDPPTVAQDGMAATEPGKPGWLESRVPRKVEVGRVQVRDGNVRFPLGAGREARVLGAALDATRLPDGEGYKVELQGGRVSFLPFFGQSGNAGAMAVDRGAIEMRGKNFAVQQIMLSGIGHTARATVDGQVALDDGVSEMRIDTTVNDLPVAELLGVKWADRLVGRFNGEIVTEKRPGDSAVMTHGRVWLKEARLNTPSDQENQGVIAQVDRLAAATGLSDLFGGVVPMLGAYTESRERFSSIFFNKAEFRFVRRGEDLQLREIELRSNRFIAVEGDVNIYGETIDGLLDVGVDPSVLTKIPGAETKVFTRSEGGMRWTRVRLSGTLNEPKEDLTDRLIAAAGARVLEIIPESGQAVIKGTRRVIEDVTPQVLESGAGLLREGAGLLEEGQSSLFQFLDREEKRPEPEEEAEEQDSSGDTPFGKEKPGRGSLLPFRL
ncbi:hypothetical protein [Sulfuriroseicoccus oceanibius]|uniref:AsmA-like C-terminal domain-containing protein n=1 Tax=Sulfuriroseicoccus oceanibius TaxID=2707525 RepID=A0A6B3L0J9_9BACT|nr:hypothetical protein [Sulfuriroseicoccus oceanibius]QQL43899.1 hypothetical protein G3M56_008315 [Sulfuriroseicoccus oceanibius]